MKSLSLFKYLLIYISAAYLVVGGSFEIFSLLNETQNLVKYLRVVNIIVLFVLIIQNTRFRSLERLLALDFYLLIYLIFSGSLFNFNANVLLTFVDINLLYLFVSNYESRGGGVYLFQAFSTIVVILALISVSLWLLGPVLGIIKPFGDFFVERGEKISHVYNYYYLCFSVNELDFFDYILPPNDCIFREKAFAATTFLLSLIYELFIKSKKSFIVIGILYLALISTLSTTALFLGLAVGALSITIAKSKEKNRRLPWIFAILILFLTAGIAQDILLEKFVTHSGESRLSDLYNGVTAWMNSPLFGYGFGNVEALARFGAGYSSSVSLILVSGGIVLALLYLYPIFKAMVCSLRVGNSNLFCFVVSFLLILLINRCAFNVNIYYVLIFVSLNLPKTPKYV